MILTKLLSNPANGKSGLKLADPTTVKNNKTKFSDDIADAEFLADQMRLGALKAADIIPKQDRAFRDLVRLRVDLVQDRARYRTCARQGALLEVKVLRSARRGVRSSDSARASR